jgi:hypothetical protein
MTELNLEEALLTLNGWIGQRVGLRLLLQLGSSNEPPPAEPAEGWHVVMGRNGELGKPDSSEHDPASEDRVRQLTIGTYEVGDSTTKLLLDGMPCERVLALENPRRLAFYLPGSVAVLVVSLLSA